MPQLSVRESVALRAAFSATRSATELFAAALGDEDQLLQAMPEASPVKWHRAHTTWFFEAFVLQPRGVQPFDSRYAFLFNSYYESLGPRHARPQRGLLSRPTVQEIAKWRRHVDALILERLHAPEGIDAELAQLMRLGIAHEQQHQELMQTDLLAAFATSPFLPTYATEPYAVPPVAARDGSVSWLTHDGGKVQIGAEPSVPFTFDNEGPRHEVWLAPFSIADRLVTIKEWLAFAVDGGYESPSLWLAEGLDWVRSRKIEGPAYLRREGETVIAYGLHGTRVPHPDEPVLHLSLYEADALAAWSHARLPTEHEWETWAANLAGTDESTAAFPRVPQPQNGSHGQGLFGQAWQWTRSSYAPYPGFKASRGAAGEYNGKFMVNQYVLRGSSIFTPLGHSRVTYRNFWHPHTQFQATGLRLARDA